jgi:hypothetical protein
MAFAALRKKKKLFRRGASDRRRREATATRATVYVARDGRGRVVASR